MSMLEKPDLLYLESAKGWYLLGDLQEAARELDKLSSSKQEHPDVLEVRFAIQARLQNWGLCMETATSLLEAAPERPTAWINCATVLHGLKETRAAWHTLYNVLDRFPKVALIPYNLAVFGCVLGESTEALQMLERAFALGGEDLRKQALREPELKSLVIPPNSAD
jgi:tetratricopeptide (TPR) repeat protein